MRRFLACLALLLLFAQWPPTKVHLAGSSEPRPAAADKSPLPGKADMERLARTNPVGFLEQCLRRYDRDVRGYTAILRKQERIDGKLQKTEVIEVAFRERPYSVYLHWLENPHQADALAYVEGENGGNMLVRPSLGLLRSLIVQRDPEGDEVRQSGRYTLKQFGIKKGMERTLAGWRAAQKKGELHVAYEGEVPLKEAGNRPCVKLHRTRFARPEKDGVADLTVYFDKENWLQIGSVLKDAEGNLVGSYYFKDVRLNPEFKANQFAREGLKP
jgi:hypothetical protein